MLNQMYFPQKKGKKIITLTVLMLAICVVLYAETITIPDDYATIQEGLDSANEEDTVFVTTGVYYENIFWPETNSINLIGCNIDSCIIDGNATGRVIEISNSSILIDSTTSISNFTIQNGLGGFRFSFNCNPILKNLKIINNTIIDSFIARGGGIYCFEANPIIDNVVIKNNSATSDRLSMGGGIYCDESSPYLKNIILQNNSAGNFGGGIFGDDDSNIILVDAMILENQAGEYGGGIMAQRGSNYILENVKIVNNSAYYGGGGIITYLGSSLNFSSENRCNVYSNTIESNKGGGADFFSRFCPDIDIIVDTFTVANPTDYYVTPVDSFTYDIIHSMEDSLINGDIYVSVSGDNSNSGTSANCPFKTISHALESIFADSNNVNTIHLDSGIYSPSNNGENYPLNWVDYVNLSGCDTDSTILDAENTGRVIMFNSVKKSKLTNLSITGGSSVGNGGGIYCDWYSTPIIKNVKIYNNNSNRSGGGIYCRLYSEPTFKNVLVSNNSANVGAGIAAQGANLNLINLTISDNSATTNGGAIFLFDAHLDLINSIVSHNTGNFGMYMTHFSTSNMKYSNFYNPESGNFYNCSPDLGCIEIDPLFADTINADYNLSEDSPCIDAGIPDTIGLNLPLWDLDGNVRVWDGNDDGVAIIDMGVYEFAAPNYSVEEPQIPENMIIYNYPNPVQTSTIFQYSLKKNTHVTLSFYNIKGQLVKTLVDKNQEVGIHAIEYDTEALSPGVYFYKIETGYLSETGKMLKLK